MEQFIVFQLRPVVLLDRLLLALPIKRSDKAAAGLIDAPELYRSLSIHADND